jgi:hypothetical protein
MAFPCSSLLWKCISLGLAPFLCPVSASTLRSLLNTPIAYLCRPYYSNANGCLIASELFLLFLAMLKLTLACVAIFSVSILRFASLMAYVVH